MEFSITQNGKKLDSNKYNWVSKTKTFSSNEDNLVLDFKGINGITFKTGDNCTFTTGSYCTFNTGYSCTFETGSYCTFTTLDDCTFITWSGCTFTTLDDCTFNTGSGCIFNTGNLCTFNTWSGCIFNTGNECVIIRRDVYEIIELKKGKKIQLNGHKEKGYEEISDDKTITIDGKDITISK